MKFKFQILKIDFIKKQVKSIVLILPYIMELTRTEISYIGTNDECLHAKTNLRRIAKCSSSFFHCMDYKFRIEKGYKRNIWLSEDEGEKYVESDEITKYSYGIGFFPAYMCREGVFRFGSEINIGNHTWLIQEELGEYLEIISGNRWSIEG